MRVFVSTLFIALFMSLLSFIGSKTEAILWLKADKDVKVDTKGNVYFWKDQTKNQNNAVQDNEYKRPSLVKKGINGMPVIKFDGVDDILKVAKLDLHNTVCVEVFVVFKSSNENSIVYEQSTDINTNLSGFYLVDHYANGNSGLSASVKGNAARGCENYNGNNSQSALFTNYNSNEFKITDLVIDKSKNTASQIRLFANNRELSSNGTSYYCNHSDKFRNDEFYIGGRYKYDNGKLKGEIAELIVFPKTLTQKKRKEIYTYLHSKYIKNK